MPATSRSISYPTFLALCCPIPEEICPATKVTNLLWKDEKYSAVVRALMELYP